MVLAGAFLAYHEMIPKMSIFPKDATCALWDRCRGIVIKEMMRLEENSTHVDVPYAQQLSAQFGKI